MRQNQAANAPLFEAFPTITAGAEPGGGAGLVAILTAPLLERFRNWSGSNRTTGRQRWPSGCWRCAVRACRRCGACASIRPARRRWSRRCATEKPSVLALTGDGGISSLLLLIERADRQLLLLPDGATRLQAGDHLLFGRRTARSEQMLLLNNVNALIRRWQTAGRQLVRLLAGAACLNPGRLRWSPALADGCSCMPLACKPLWHWQA